MLHRSLLASLLLPMALVACDKSGAPDQGGGTGDAPVSHAASIPCALAGAASFGNDCTVERETSAQGLILTLHHPDGGFRRLLVTTDGRGVATADGSDPATISVIDPTTIEVRVGEDRYRLPATVKGQALPKR